MLHDFARGLDAPISSWEKSRVGEMYLIIKDMPPCIPVWNISGLRDPIPRH
ncbi:hypothetical protein [Cupriavidus sp. amp6]|uniref:hypothetical protein n=1 Tax=Cupriavidus sp. amp6 TaxID=388051 RepID=UPI0018DDE154|nr:hypothetical protein [Cupriavidus sp. amp6]